jgi:hypothetical protein
MTKIRTVEPLTVLDQIMLPLLMPLPPHHMKSSPHVVTLSLLQVSFVLVFINSLLQQLMLQILLLPPSALSRANISPQGLLSHLLVLVLVEQLQGRESTILTPKNEPHSSRTNSRTCLCRMGKGDRAIKTLSVTGSSC